MRRQLVLLFLLGLSVVLGNECREPTHGCASLSLSEEEIEAEEELEAGYLDVRLLQTHLHPSKLPVKELEETRSGAATGSASPALVEADEGELAHATEQQSETAQAGIVSLDHNGNVCMLCGRPLPERVGERLYSEFRVDCGSRSSPTGPSADDLSKPAASFVARGHGRETTGFCELNFAKGCADAVANKDYLYWPKSLDLKHPALRENAAWDGRYCHANGFLKPEFVALQHNFSAFRDKADELCRTKYSQLGGEKLTFLDMMQLARHEDTTAPSLKEAELLAAWNCAMGDLGCDLAMCIYSFCDKGGGEIGLYDECPGWHPVHGMPTH